MRLTAKFKLDLLVALRKALDAIPDDHSCHSCDLFTRDEQDHPFCVQWQATIPEGNLEDGCDHWKDEGVPF